MASNTVRFGWTFFAAGVESLNDSKTSPQYSHWGDSSCSRLHLGHFVIALIFCHSRLKFNCSFILAFLLGVGKLPVQKKGLQMNFSESLGIWCPGPESNPAHGISPPAQPAPIYLLWCPGPESNWHVT